MAHPNEVLNKQVPTKIVLVDEAQVFTGSFYAFTPVILGTGITSVVVQTAGEGTVTQYDSGTTKFAETAVKTNITMPAAVGVTIFGRFSKFTGDANSSYILYLSDQ